MAKTMDPILPVLLILGCWAIILGSFGGPGRVQRFRVWELGLGPALAYDLKPKKTGRPSQIPQQKARPPRQKRGPALI